MDLVEIGLGELDWIGLAQDRYRWRALVNSVEPSSSYEMLGNCIVTALLVDSPVVLRSAEFGSGSEIEYTQPLEDNWGAI
jgi:hypothetical protein